MEQYSLKEAQQQLEKLIKDAQHGKTVLILDEQARLIQLVPLTPAVTRQAGSARGLVVIADDFDEPLADFDEYTR